MMTLIMMTMMTMCLWCLTMVLCLSTVCTCVVHKRCHLEVVSQCPGVKQELPELFPSEEKVFDMSHNEY